MGGADQKIHPELMHSHWFMGQALTGIEQDKSSMLRGQADHLIHRIAATQGVTDMHQGHQPGSTRELTAQVFKIKGAMFGHTDMTEHTSSALGQQLPRHKIAVMLHHGEEHLVARLEIGIAPGAGYKIDRLAGISGENDLAGTSRCNKTSRDQSCAFKRLCGTGAELMGPAMHIGVVVAVVALQSL